MTASFGSTRTASSGSTRRSDDASIRPHPRLPRSSIVAGARRTSRSYVLASLRALHLDLRLVASDQAAAEERHTPGQQLTASQGRGHFKPTSDMPDSWWGHFKASRWVQLKASQPEGGRQQVFGLGIVLRARHRRFLSLVRRYDAGFLCESHSPALAGS
jgi:hypothetical protein